LGIGKDNDPAHTITSGDRHAVFKMREGKAGGGKGPLINDERAFTVSSFPDQFLREGQYVRRLTPLECERLQGFPDNYTLIDYGKRKRDLVDYYETVLYLESHGLNRENAIRLANCPDGPRYKALGNSMAVNVMRWIGERIKQVEK
jgi:DNA (cytosine-5)-methyltransferase 1